MKGVAISCVVVGHCIQFGSGGAYMESGVFFEHPLFRMIYSWHMPLFMLVSGYLFGLSITRHSFLTLLHRRSRQLLLPILSWGTLGAVMFFLAYPESVLSVKDLLTNWLTHVFFGSWFIWALLLLSLFVLMVHHFLHDRIFIYAGAFILTFFVPNMWNMNLYMFMYPFFIVGYMAFCRGWMHKFDWRKYNNHIFILLGVSYMILFSWFHYSAYIYTSGYSIFLHYRTGDIAIWKFWNDLFRMVIGFFGSALIMLIIWKLWRHTKQFQLWKGLQKLGRASLAIYLFSDAVINGYFLQWITKSASPSLLWNAFETVAVLLVCYFAYRLLEHFSWGRKIFLGGR